jgi:hypothetical protein
MRIATVEAHQSEKESEKESEEKLKGKIAKPANG